jgi:sulfite exporter TauE/SafE
MTDPLVTGALLVGLAGGVHCAAMCGGIVAALSLRDRPPQPVRFVGGGAATASFSLATTLPTQIAYSAGRVVTYSVIGAVAGGLGELGLMTSSVLPVQLMLLVVANALVVLMGLHLAGLGSSVLILERAGGVVWRTLQHAGATLKPANGPGGAFATGLAWGCVPCGLVYSVLATALVSGSAARGALIMAALGLGTLPNVLATGLVAERLRTFVRRPRVRLAAGLAVAAIGLWGLVRIPGIADHVRHGLLCIS